MQCKTSFAILAGFLFSAGAINAQQAYTIKIKDSVEGDVVLVKKNDTVISKVKVVDPKGKTSADEKNTVIDNVEYLEKYVKGAAGKPGSVRHRDYSKAKITKNGKMEDSPLHGKFVIIEALKNDKFLFAYKDGEAVSGSAREMLTREFSRKGENAEIEKIVLPKDPVKVGDSWKIDMAQFVKVVSQDGKMDLDAGKSVGKGTLVKVYKKDNHQFGEMKFKLELPIRSMELGKNQVPFAAGAKMMVDIEFDVCIDGTLSSGTMKTTMSMSGTAMSPGGGTLSLDVVMDGTQSGQEMPKK